MNKALHARFLWCALAVPRLALPAPWMPGVPAGIYACTDAKGRRLTADRPIAECVDRDQRVLGSSGVELRRVGPTLTDNERAELDAQRRREQADKRRVREERSRERALIARYPNQATHDAERAEALSQTDQVANLARQRIQGAAGPARQDRWRDGVLPQGPVQGPPLPCAASSMKTAAARKSSSASSSSRSRKKAASTSASMPSSCRCVRCGARPPPLRLPRAAERPLPPVFPVWRERPAARPVRVNRIRPASAAIAAV